MTLGERIEALRKQHQMTQQDLATKSHVTQAMISALEHDQRPRVSLVTVARIARAFGLTVDTLREGVKDSEILPASVEVVTRFLARWQVRRLRADVTLTSSINTTPTKGK